MNPKYLPYDAWTWDDSPKPSVPGRSYAQSSYNKWLTANGEPSQEASSAARKYYVAKATEADRKRLASLAYNITDAMLAWYYEDILAEEAFDQARSNLFKDEGVKAYQIDLYGLKRKTKDELWEPKGILASVRLTGTHKEAVEAGVKASEDLVASDPENTKVTSFTIDHAKS